MKYAIINDLDANPMSVIDTETMWQFPMANDNAMYQAYLAWVAEGNTAESWNPEPASVDEAQPSNDAG